MTDPLLIAREVLTQEIKGLEMLKIALGEDFAGAVALLNSAEGRVVVTGMGKSGHVARKIAATLASTGTSAIFVHPAEASHGDLGMISDKDIILALSKSGETAELGDLLAHAARFTIPVLAITSELQSTLAKAAVVTLGLPPAQEACGETLAPTTSTTMMMALGDALAVALLREKGFTAGDFRGFHPGGRLGAALRRARDLMHGSEALPLIDEQSPMPMVLQQITNGGFGCVGVIDTNGVLRGVITDGDIRRQVDKVSDRIQARDVMTKDPRTATPDTLAGDVLAYMSRNKITSVFVIEDKRPVGIIHVHDCLSIGVL
ncbi:KpsF/GutQ family sugar-phosphate isomerase [Hyphococcus sp.]|uniref:KpsF/GutQ family sugar-phosphate isomerase n=1 Tax=Hyphococcus sp. TaxID=2038636 RepID=UPI003CCB9AB4